MAAISKMLGKHQRIYIATSATPADDDAYSRVVNENSLTITRDGNVTSNSTKEAGNLTNPGDESWEVSGDFNANFTDTGFAEFEDQFNVAYPYQIRNTSGSVETVVAEGVFVLASLEYTAESTDVVSGSFTLNNSGPVTWNGLAGRALV